MNGGDWVPALVFAGFAVGFLVGLIVGLPDVKRWRRIARIYEDCYQMEQKQADTWRAECYRLRGLEPSARPEGES